MVGAAGIVASTINNRHQRRESRGSQHGVGGGDEGHGGHHHHNRHGSRATISDSLRLPPAPPPNSTAYTYASGVGGVRGSQPPPLSTPGSKPPPPPPDELNPELIPEKLSLAEQVKFYVSLGLGIVASLCVFALLFLIPLVVEPSISTLLADFDPSPGVCVTVDYTSATGLSKCGLWASCREGCTSTPSQCHQIYVSYRRAGSKLRPRIRNNTILDPHDWLDESRWDVSYTQLLVNAKGCGYPPRVKCDEFGDTYGLQGRTFECYHSRSNPRLVVTDYNWEETASPLLLALGAPTLLFSLSIAILSSWYCPSCEERGKNKRPCRSRYRSAPTNDHTSSATQPPNQPPRSGSSSRRRLPSSSDQPLPSSGGGGHMPTPPLPIIAQPPPRNNKDVPPPPRSPSLATISSRDTTISSVNSMDDGWQSPPSPPPRMAGRLLNAHNPHNHHHNNGPGGGAGGGGGGGGGGNKGGGARARKL